MSTNPIDRPAAEEPRTVRAPDRANPAVLFELDGQQVEAAAGETIWAVAKRLGTHIPHL